MLAKRIIPCLDVKEGRVVKGVNFLNLRDAGDPVEQARIYDAQGADELVAEDANRWQVDVDTQSGQEGLCSLDDRLIALRLPLFGAHEGEMR